MKRTLMLLAAGLAATTFLLLGGCSSAQLQTAESFQKNIDNACLVAQATISDVKAAQLDTGDLTKLMDDVDKACDANASIDTSSVTSLAKTSIPAAIGIVQSSGLSDAKKKAIRDGLLVFQAALLNALLLYGGDQPVPDAPAPASTTVATQ
ncbi:hypothetical protein QYH69_29330 [Paraburkholderia sp. SARCC-3016]|uniref:hypothetical protein n=1 Tax=Paraburkholderia sp. SARCC-3016 TaxID=3058611 RepID=UPI002807C9D5|nr:hypothetical protein [Paraburkholderia sp. SARCC-3016]MDQ7981338.1 hypothetical protein [Paraburkholderia sp. SARCC-3016]